MPLSYVHPQPDSPWGTYLMQVDRVLPYLGHPARWAETLKRPKRALIVDVPIELDNGEVAHFEGFRVQHNLSRGPGKGGDHHHAAHVDSRSCADPSVCHDSGFGNWWTCRHELARSGHGNPERTALRD